MSSFDRDLEGADGSRPRDAAPAGGPGLRGRGRRPATTTSCPDPKTRVDTLAEIQRAYRLYAAGDLESAVPAYQQIVDENPKIEDAWDYLALRTWDWVDARRRSRSIRPLEQIPHSKRLRPEGGPPLAAGRLDEAFVYAIIAIPYDPPAAHLLLAQIAFKRGDLEGAEMEAREAMSSGDRRPGARLVLADILIARGEPREAIDLLIADVG